MKLFLSMNAEISASWIETTGKMLKIIDNKLEKDYSMKVKSEFFISLFSLFKFFS